MFALCDIDYVVLYLTKDGTKPQQVHASIIIQFAVPQDVKTLRSSLSLCKYCAEFIANFATIAEPIAKLLRKTQPWAWASEQQEAFKALKRLMAEPSVIWIIPNLLFCIRMIVMLE
jgi:hypothetical protein